MNQGHVTEFLPAYALGCLDADERERVGAHLAGCDLCSGQWAEFVQVADQLGSGAPLKAPPEHLKDRLMLTIGRRPTDASPRTAGLIAKWMGAPD
ncbi:MAG: hypothetical protein C4519_10350 [Desulfobacteraceae bacterium]|nr:MAG: hypothetical protein C4519_10350 [Desulfobacteraceae bacterium]